MAEAKPRASGPLRGELARIFRGRSGDEWNALLQGSNACFALVLALGSPPA